MDQATRLFREIYQAIQAAERILVVADGKPDGDAVGSSTAMFIWLNRLGKHTELFCPSAIPSPLKFLDSVDRFTSDPSALKHPYDLVLIFDASDLQHGGNDMVPAHLPKPYKLVCFDHHATNPRYADLNAVFSEASSTCEVTYRFFTANQIEIDDKMATSLLTGLITDTSNFSNPATNSLAVEAASQLSASGARFTDILKNIVRNKSVVGLKLWGLALERLHFRPEYDLAFTYFLVSDLEGIPGADEAVEGVSNFLNATCSEADTILVLRERPDGTLKGSLRSQNRDISKLAQLLGGGGHKKASGFTIQGKLQVRDGIPMICQPL